MKKLLLLLSLSLLLAACGSNETAVVDPTAIPPTAAQVAVDVVAETAVSEEPLAVTTKPKLVEFYADW